MVKNTFLFDIKKTSLITIYIVQLQIVLRATDFDLYCAAADRTNIYISTYKNLNAVNGT